MKKETISAELVERYLRNDCTPEEKKEVEEWYASFEDEPDPLSTLSVMNRRDLKRSIYTKIRNNVQHPGADPEVRKAGVKRLYRPMLAAAASIVIIFGAALYFGVFSGGSEMNRNGKKNDLQVSNFTRRLKKYILPDSSVIWLKPATTITWFYRNGSGLREVGLDGECFFDIKHNASRPFIIYSNHVTTRVLGTSFNIRAYKNSEATEVSVVSGKVVVSEDRNGGSKGVYLLQNQKAVYRSDKRILKKERSPVSSMQLWEKNSFVFDNVPVKEVVKVLAEKFSVKITIEDPVIKNYTLKADFTSQNLPDIIEMMSKSLDINYEIYGNEITMQRNN